MNITEYQHSLPSTIARDGLMEDILAASTLYGSLFKFAAQMRDSALKAPSKNTKVYNLHSASKVALKKGPFEFVTGNKSNILENLRTLEDALATLPAEMVTKSMTIDTLAIISLVEAAHVAATWTLSYFLEVVKGNYTASKEEDYQDEVATSRGALRRMNEDFGKFVWAVQLIASKPKDFASKVKDIEGIFLTENAEAKAKGTSALRSHPLKSTGSAGFIGNPIYAVGMYVASWRAHTYKLVDEEIVQLELILLASEAESRGEKSPQLEKKIRLINERIAEKRMMLKDIVA